MSDAVSRAQSYALENEARFVEDLRKFLQIPSIATQGTGMQECATWLVQHLNDIGIKAWLEPTAGYPVVCGEVPGATDRWVVVYGHYDVQPPEPLEEWIHPPFAAVLEGDRIYARGAVDDKGNLFCAVKAVESYLAAGERPPVGVKFFIEGEEEIGSPNLASFADAHRDWLKADGLILQDGLVAHDGRTELNLGMKGLLYLELRARTHDRDLHSGKAPIVENAGWRLVHALASLQGPDGRVRVPGFYDGVLPPSEDDLELLRTYGPSEEVVKAEAGIDRFPERLKGRDPLVALYFEPVMTICGVVSGYAGPGQKTVVPSTATAKIDIRLVPGQDPGRLIQAIRAHLDREGFTDVELVPLGAGQPASRTNPRTPVARAMHAAIRTEFGKDPIVKPSVESSGPGCVFSDVLGLPWALTRFGPAGSTLHAPNEFFAISHYRRGISTIVRFLDEFARALEGQ
ncbi:MAG: M20/M25/M40 family metallo-hydrolase [Firmicutes bacterium]|nr:M20/M25/M40 family metallo-hydrolase [Bacillota bacterium]